jgi:omega-amidase
MQLRVTTVQTDLHWQDKKANLAQYTQLLAQLKPDTTDLVVLPEMFTTGFTMNPQLVKETLADETIQWMAQQAERLNAVLMGSFVRETAADAFSNTMVWMPPNKVFALYDKRHLFTLAGEHKFYQKGQTRLLTEWQNWRFCPLVCYDLRFPVWSRNVKLPQQRPDYDVLIYVANWPAVRREAWKSLLVARAIENQAYVVGVNIVGKDGNNIQYSGDTMVIDYSGTILYSKFDECDLATHTLNYENLTQFRQKFSFLDDQDIFRFGN